MSDRDELIEMIQDRVINGDGGNENRWSIGMADAIIGAGWRPPVPYCDHHWSTDRSTYGGNPWRECLLCGKQEDL